MALIQQTANEPPKPAMVRLEDQMNNENLEMLQQIFEVCELFYSSKYIIL